MITAVDHIGVRVAEAARAETFYAKLGFDVAYRSAVAPVVVLRNAAGIEVHLVVNAESAFDGTNILMDTPEKRAGYTHVALRVGSIADAERDLRAAGLAITEGPVRLGRGVSVFVRDPDRNVVELHELLDERDPIRGG